MGRMSNTGHGSSSSGPVRRVLVKWLEGEHKGKYTHNVNIEWIQNLLAPYPTHGETYAIEWRVPPKPRSGWPVIDAIVLETSSDLDYLKSRMTELESADEDGNIDNSRASPNSLMDINSEAFRELVRSLVTRQETPRRRRHSSPPPQTSEERVCVGKSLWISKAIHTMAVHATSPGRVIRPLLRQAFSRRRLINSSYAGQRRMINGKEYVKPGLKRYQKMADIHAFVLERYPALSQASFGALVNSFLGERPNAIHQIEYVEESQSEESDVD